MPTPDNPPARLVLALAVALTLAGCAVVDQEVAANGAQEPFSGVATDVEEPEDPDEVEQVHVPLEIVDGAAGSTLAFVPVFIRGEGPFPFALDTGASNSVVHDELAEDLELEVAGSPQPVTGVTGDGEAVPVTIEDWRIGDLQLEAVTASALPLPAAEEGMFVGLLGSDVLSTFGSVLVDYDRGELVLSPRRS